jgi:hypothetical protein
MQQNTCRMQTCFGIGFPFYLFLFIFFFLQHSMKIIKVILLADTICSRLLAWFGSPIIKKIIEYHPLNVYGYVEIWMYIMSQYSTIPNCSEFDFLVYIFYIGS